jgi:D-amino-acid dehydrogenase
VKPDVIIVGGGAVGLCTAYYLQRDGASVTILESRTVGSGSSLHNAGLVVPSHFIPLAAPGVVGQGLRWLLDPESPLYIKLRSDPDLIYWLWKFMRSSTHAHVAASMSLLRDLHQASLRLYEQLESEEGLEFILQKHGLLMVFRTPEGLRSCTHEADAARRIGVEARILSQAETQTLNPHVHISAAGSLFFPGDAHLSPEDFLYGLRSLLERRGVRIVENSPVTGVHVDGSRVVAVTTPSDEYRPSAVVLAGGSWSAQIIRPLGIRLPLQPGKGYSITVAAPAAFPSMPMILVEARVSVTPFPGSLRFAGTMELVGLDESINRRRVRAILRAVPEYLEVDTGQGETAATLWGGLRPCSPDGLPYIGAFPGTTNLIAATGHAMIGISLAPITGKLVSEILSGTQPSIDIRGLRPGRFA